MPLPQTRPPSQSPDSLRAESTGREPPPASPSTLPVTWRKKTKVAHIAQTEPIAGPSATGNAARLYNLHRTSGQSIRSVAIPQLQTSAPVNPFDDPNYRDRTRSPSPSDRGSFSRVQVVVNIKPKRKLNTDPLPFPSLEVEDDLGLEPRIPRSRSSESEQKDPLMLPYTDFDGNISGSSFPPEPEARVTHIPDDKMSDFWFDGVLETLDEEEEDGGGDNPGFQPNTSPEATTLNPNQVYTTPAHRAVVNGMNLVKQLVIELDPNGGACLLTLMLDPKRSRQACHIIARRTKSGLLTIIEWKWGMRYMTLYIDSRFNIILLKSDWHILLDSNNWVLIPHRKWISRVREWMDDFEDIYNATDVDKSRRRPITEIYSQKDQVFEYFMLPLTEDMQRAVITRYAEPNVPDVVTVYKYPFTDLPVLRSCCRPHFVMFSAGEKLAPFKADHTMIAHLAAYLGARNDEQHRDGSESEQLANEQLLQDLIGTYETWSKNPSSAAEKAAMDAWKKVKKNDNSS
ncbi:HNHc domain-containing protein [Mycena indigotica]|uniref:HNHc domain-containing protein n=1 Tax=Mycena indigotica TaxID=2126181 RepID=A0A8H6TEM2_9AGAR|nr:HNHc domain-containing protein [Mycena indigotica]KAF7315844.1 HNHc domain-containing protein [Mycena indigotica]